MALPRELKDKKDMIIYRLTTIVIDRKKNVIAIVHAGNMGNNLNSVRKNVDGALGKGMLDKLRKEGHVLLEEGTPDYLYNLILQF